MSVPSFEHSPAVTEILACGRSSRAGQWAAFIALGSRGWVEVAEAAEGPPRMRLTRPPEASDAALPETERWLYAALAAWTKDPARTPQTDEWLAAVGRQAAAEGALDPAAWSAVRSRSFFPFLARRALPGAKASSANAFAGLLASFPAPDGPLPQTRPEWDSVFAFAAALGQAEGFLERARTVNDYYARHFQGVVMTFFTPAWYRPVLREGLGRFAYLTTGLSALLSRPVWKSVTPT